VAQAQSNAQNIALQGRLGRATASSSDAQTMRRKRGIALPFRQGPKSSSNLGTQQRTKTTDAPKEDNLVQFANYLTPAQTAATQQSLLKAQAHAHAREMSMMNVLMTQASEMSELDANMGIARAQTQADRYRGQADGLRSQSKGFSVGDHRLQATAQKVESIVKKAEQIEKQIQQLQNIIKRIKQGKDLAWHIPGRGSVVESEGLAGFTISGSGMLVSMYQTAKGFFLDEGSGLDGGQLIKGILSVAEPTRASFKSISGLVTVFYSLFGYFILLLATILTLFMVIIVTIMVYVIVDPVNFLFANFLI
jgi:hypothetical protein